MLSFLPDAQWLEADPRGGGRAGACSPCYRARDVLAVALGDVPTSPIGRVHSLTLALDTLPDMYVIDSSSRSMFGGAVCLS